MTTPRLLSPREVALRGGLAVQTLYNRIARYRAGAARPVNFPRVIMLGGRVRFPESDVDRWLAEGDGPLVTREASADQPTPCPEPGSAA